MASISEKLVTVAENTPKVHHAGQLNVVQSAQSLKGSESNTAMLLDDISPVTHEMGVRVKSKNLIPFPYRDLKLGTSTYNGIDFTVYEDGSILINGTATRNTTRYLYSNTTDLLGLKSGITISGSKNASDDTQQANVYFICNYYDSAAKMQMGIQASTVASGTKTITDDWKGLGIYLHIPSGKTLNNLLIKPQLEIGSTPTAYTPYVPDLTAVKVSRYGKNLFDISSSRGFESTIGGLNNTINGNTLEVVCTVKGRIGYLELGTYPKGTYTFSCNKSFENLSQRIMIGNDISNLKALGSNFVTNTKTFSLSKESKVWVRNTGFSRGGSPFIYSNIQLELNSTVTDYEEYVTPTDYTPTVDGTVNGVTSLYPNTTLITDTDGVIIDCNYYKDIDKAYNKLSAAIALSGGE